jgi:hypothetical protein
MNQITLSFLKVPILVIVILILNITKETFAGEIERTSNKKLNTDRKESNTLSAKGFDLLPDGNTFPFWDDQTKYSKVLHVAQKNPKASDENPGTFEKPFKTINAAARVLQPGEKVIVHEGVYRECVRPLRGGTANNKMIAYEEATGEKVVIKGSEIWKPNLVPSSGWRMNGSSSDVKIMMADMPEELFKAYNPFSIRNAYHYLTVYGQPNDPDWMERAMLFRGSVYLNGEPLKQVYKINELSKNDSAFWVEDPGLRLHLRLPKDTDVPNNLIEITTREQIFAPKEYGLGYIRVSGFTFEHTGDGLPVPQRAAVSTMRGHHWIIENNIINQVHACGLDIGLQSWEAAKQEISGYHIIRHNIIRNAGICGIAGAMYADNSLIEDNLIERIGSLDLERMYECAGIKFHVCNNVMVRRNIIRNINHAAGIWFDSSSSNCRIVNNVFADICTLTAGIYMEMDYEQNLIDHNILWDIRNDVTPKGWEPPYVHGAGIRVDCNDKLIIAHNFFGKVKLYAVCINLVQSARKQDERTGICFNNKVVNNIFYDTPNRIYLAAQRENIIDGNLYDKKNEGYSFILLHPQPSTVQNLTGWQDFFGLDKHSTETMIKADFDVTTNQLEITAEGKLPEWQTIKDLMNGKITSQNPGPFTAEPSQKSSQMLNIKQKFPLELK